MWGAISKATVRITMSTQNEYKQGPFSNTVTKTFEIAPIKITITEKTESSHVPPTGGCGCGGNPMLDAIAQYARAAAGQAVSSVVPGPTVATNDEP